MKIYRNVTDFRYINKFLARSQITLNPLNSRGLKCGLSDCNTKESRLLENIDIDFCYNKFYIIVVNVKKSHNAIVETIESIAKANGGVVSTANAEKQGVSRAVLSQMAANGGLDRVAKGFYVLPTELPDELLILSLCSPNIVFSHETALFLNGITERTPAIHSFTLPRDKRLSSAFSKECTIHYAERNSWNIGKTEIKTPMGNLVPCFDAERTICDLIKYKKKFDPETYIASLKMYAKMQTKNLQHLSEYAQKLGIVEKVRDALEVLL